MWQLQDKVVKSIFDIVGCKSWKLIRPAFFQNLDWFYIKWSWFGSLPINLILQPIEISSNIIQIYKIYFKTIKYTYFKLLKYISKP